MKHYVMIFLLLTLFGLTEGLTCQSCELASCPVLVECQAGMVMDVCGCCLTCAKQQGEACGGIWDLYGQCALELFCDQDDDADFGTCKECEEVVYSGCNVLQGICQCGDSCTLSFEFSDRESCINSVKAYGDVDHCRGKSCPSNASADEECPEDSFRPPTKLSADGCCQISQECKCLNTPCHAPPKCPAGKRLSQLTSGDGLAGSCCSQYTCIDVDAYRCDVGNSTFVEGEVVKLDNCQECKCKAGVVTCNHVKCDSPACEWSVLSAGKCCPRCEGCVSSTTGESYYNGESWVEQDACVTCKCVQGRTHCTAASCERRCQNPKRVSGRCCPVCEEEEVIYASPNVTEEVKCPDTSLCPTSCRKKMSVEINGCSICVCEDDVNMCPGSSDCTKVCPHGYKKDRDFGCSYCRCNACPMFSCNLVCLHGYVKDSTGCNVCRCKEDKKMAGVCFTSEGRSYQSGSMWFDGCRMCYCESGREMCTLISCPSLNCTQPVVRAGDCCPSCPSEPPLATAVNISTSCKSEDSEYIDSTAWQMDRCTTCICHQGTALCETQRCPPILCTHPVLKDGHCCPQCDDGTLESQLSPDKSKQSCVTAAKVKFDHGSIWKIGDCQSCTCSNGFVTCFSQSCPILRCDVTVQRKGQCCPVCAGGDDYQKVCVYEGRWYNHLDTWKDGEMQCTCYHSQADCFSTAMAGASFTNSQLGTAVEKKDSIPNSVVLPTIIILSVVLLVFAIVIVLLTMVIVRRRRLDKSQPTAIPKILEKRAIVGGGFDSKRRPKSTNLEFLHATTENRYSSVNADAECCRPLVETNRHGNEYVQC